MNVKINNRHVEITESLQKLIDRQVDKLEKFLPTFAPHDVDLHVSLEGLPRGKQFHTALVLTIPQTAIRVEELENNPSSSVHQAFEELLRKVIKFKSRLNRERFRQKQPSPVLQASTGGGARELENSINQNLTQIENYIRRELYHQALSENIPVGLVQAQALVDEVFLEVSAKIEGKPENLPLEQWMFRIARNMLSNRVSELQDTRDERHVEEEADFSSRWEDETLNFYQPDEVLHWGDLLCDTSSTTPEELLQQEETQEQLQKAVAQLPGSIRESFILHAVEGFNPEETAMITGKQLSEVLEDVEKARLELHRQMANQ